MWRLPSHPTLGVSGLTRRMELRPRRASSARTSRPTEMPIPIFVSRPLEVTIEDDRGRGGSIERDPRATRVFPVNAGLFVKKIVTNANGVFIFQKRDLLVTDIGTNGDPVTRIIVLEKPSTTIPSRSKLRVESRSIGFLTRPRQRQQLHITRYYTVRLRN